VAAPRQVWQPLIDSGRRVVRLFTAGLYGLMAQWHLDPGSFSWEKAAAALAGGPARVTTSDAACREQASQPPAGSEG
jgi:hypothetical protein